VRHRLDLRGRAHGLVWPQATLGVDEVGCEDGVDQGRFAQSCLACLEIVRIARSSDVKMNFIPTQMTLNWKPRLSSFFSICWVMLSKPTWLLGNTAFPWGIAIVILIDACAQEKGENYYKARRTSVSAWTIRRQVLMKRKVHKEEVATASTDNFPKCTSTRRPLFHLHPIPGGCY
jgi:hypothetical protein